jgi:DNA-binding transcriptional MocR family regulator
MRPRLARYVLRWQSLGSRTLIVMALRGCNGRLGVIPSQKKLASDTGTPETTSHRAIRSLVEKGLISSVVVPGTRHNRYSIPQKYPAAPALKVKTTGLIPTCDLKSGKVKTTGLGPVESLKTTDLTTDNQIRLNQHPQRERAVP